MSAILNLLVCGLLTMKCWRITGWYVHHENPKSREIDALSYFLQPNKLDGECIGALKLLPDGMDIYGTFGFLKAVASKTQPLNLRKNGWLYRNGSPLTLQRLMNLTGLPPEKIERTLTILSTPPMDWMSFEELPGTPATPDGHLADSPATPDGHLADSKPAVLSTDKVLSTEGVKKETRKAASPEESKNQTRQWRAAQGRKEALEAIAEDDRTVADEQELKKMRVLLKAIQKKQAAGDFWPVEDEP